MHRGGRQRLPHCVGVPVCLQHECRLLLDTDPAQPGRSHHQLYLDKSPLVSKLSAPAQFSKEKKDQFISQGRNMDWIRDGMKLAASTKMQGSSLWMRTTHFYHQ
ncbi:hypothetical protein T310_5432 [Rasamsonia emersonii CBS 393.64]|uniref:Uncharacterized protein n=1 Tax=Rasamsonia emersonii (strain ATCC 16479 / CBS 393.64 / IMI 116815) TaxID=1408163 RepID=A0A0F4YRQ5_RASE3|nr:hypothetical protein T310_5432 [Rasamsonia emersonii CBS 393.64]KKA20536.1 hypothetical protein T310_5432 [Rasamsonia emersonii CBS 393.64]